MADAKISELPGATALAGTEIVPVVQGGVTKSVAVLAIAALTPTAATGYVHSQVTPATVWTPIEHNLGFDPAGIAVIDSDGYIRDGFGIQYLISGSTLRLSFDISLAGVAYLS